MEKNSDLFCNKSLGGSARRYLAPFWRLFDILQTSVYVATRLDCQTSFFSGQQHKKSLKLTYGGKLEESEGCNYFFVVFYVIESK